MGGVASSLLSRDMDDISSLVVRVRTEPKALWPTMEKLGQDATTRDELRAAVLAICHSDWNQFQILWSLGTLPIPKPPSLHPRVVHRLLSLRTTKAMLDTKEFWILLMKMDVLLEIRWNILSILQRFKLNLGLYLLLHILIET